MSVESMSNYGQNNNSFHHIHAGNYSSSSNKIFDDVYSSGTSSMGGMGGGGSGGEGNFIPNSSVTLPQPTLPPSPLHVQGLPPPRSHPHHLQSLSHLPSPPSQPPIPQRERGDSWMGPPYDFYEEGKSWDASAGGNSGSVSMNLGPREKLLLSELEMRGNFILEQQKKIYYLEERLKGAHMEIERLSKQIIEFDKERNRSDSGKQSQGRYWSPEEHQRFLEGLEKFGAKDIKSISSYVGTRNATQVRTHAQKYYLKLEKEKQRLAEKINLKLDGNGLPKDGSNGNLQNSSSSVGGGSSGELSGGEADSDNKELLKKKFEIANSQKDLLLLMFPKWTSDEIDTFIHTYNQHFSYDTEVDAFSKFITEQKFSQSKTVEEVKELVQGYQRLQPLRKRRKSLLKAQRTGKEGIVFSSSSSGSIPMSGGPQGGPMGFPFSPGPVSMPNNSGMSASSINNQHPNHPGASGDNMYPYKNSGMGGPGPFFPSSVPAGGNVNFSAGGGFGGQGGGPANSGGPEGSEGDHEFSEYRDGRGGQQNTGGRGGGGPGYNLPDLYRNFIWSKPGQTEEGREEQGRRSNFQTLYVAANPTGNSSSTSTTSSSSSSLASSNTSIGE